MDWFPRFGITNLDRLPHSGINMGSIAAFKHNYGIGYHVPWDSRVILPVHCGCVLIPQLLLVLLSTGHLQAATDRPRIGDQWYFEFMGEAILPGCHGFSFVYVHHFRTSTMFY
uniref:Uncharacterized protein n=1 Tax=Solanum tuberosum TaxID=4113 RepID=M1DY59_SOLTU